MAIYVSETRRKALAAKANAKPDAIRTEDRIVRMPASANPLNWQPRITPDYSVSGLGAYRRFRSHPGKSFGGSATKLTDFNARTGTDYSQVDVRSSHATPVIVRDMVTGAILRVEETKPKPADKVLTEL